jgi:hypothetical protein
MSREGRKEGTMRKATKPLPKPFVPKTPMERQLVKLVKAIFERISDDGFSEWHAWAHRIGEKGECPNSSPFMPFMREWCKADKKGRYPILLSGYEAYVKSIDPYAIVKVVRKTKA